MNRFARLAAAIGRGVLALDVGVATSLALLLSIGAAGVNAWFFVSGSDVQVLAPDRLLFYRDGAATSGVLKVAVPIRLVNRAVANFGDTVIRYQLTASTRSGRHIDFGEPESTVVVVLSDQAPGAGSCDLPARCFAIGAVQFMETPVALLDVPGSSSRETYVVFTLVEPGCAPASPACQFFDYARSAKALPQLRDVTVSVQLAADGTKRLKCRFAAPDAGYLIRNGLLTVRGLACAGGWRLRMDEWRAGPHVRI